MLCSRWLVLFSTIHKLGLRNAAYIAWYRFTLSVGFRTWRLARGTQYEATPMFRETNHRTDFPAEWRPSLLKEADRIASGEIPFFSFHWRTLGNPPDWFLNPFSGGHFDHTHRPWTEIHEFNVGGDIKIAWEPSRFTWALTLARAYMVTGNPDYLNTLNRWIADWIEQNPFNRGMNWKCGQECSIRLFHVLTASYLLNQHVKPSRKLVHFIIEHAMRIESNIRYALAQDNNHGTSEATALWLAGAWLRCASTSGAVDIRQAERWEKRGLVYFEDQVHRLVQRDGTFSQYSVTYHRVLLDTLNVALFWGRLLARPPLSLRFMERAESALRWLISMVDRDSSDAPNLGSNDGSSILRLHSREYRDFRPTVQLSSALILGARIYDDGPWDEPLYWLGLSDKDARRIPKDTGSKRFGAGGFVIIRGAHSWAVLHYPKFRFRPAHCDVMHLDLWHRGRNILRDSGTFSYNSNEAIGLDYFSSVRAHNTVQFDGMEQMPRISRFLFGRWIRPGVVGDLVEENGQVSWHGSYRDTWHHYHERRIVAQTDHWIISDDLQGFRQQAILRWRLIPALWTIRGNRILGEAAEISIVGDVKLDVSLQEGWESTCYWQKARIPVIEVSIPPDCARVITEINLR